MRVVLYLLSGWLLLVVVGVSGYVRVCRVISMKHNLHAAATHAINAVAVIIAISIRNRRFVHNKQLLQHFIVVTLTTVSTTGAAVVLVTSNTTTVITIIITFTAIIIVFFVMSANYVASSRAGVALSVRKSGDVVMLRRKWN